MSKNIIVQIKVKEAIDNQMAYIIPDYPWILIPKSTCTVIKTVEYVQELEQQIKDLQAQLNTYEIEESVTMKHVQPEPQRKSLGIYEGVEIYEETDAWFVDLKELKIVKFDHMKHSIAVAGSEGDLYDYSKMYLIPKEVNARQKEEVTKKAKKRTFTFPELEYQYDNWLTSDAIDYAIELIEKEYNIIYLPE